MSDAEPIRLLMVDDETDFLTAMSRALSRRGFHVTTAPDGTTALATLDRHPPDVVVLDVKMPGLDGVEVFRSIRLHHPRIPVILLTGHGSVRQAFETSREGVFDYLSKPTDPDRLAEVARRAVQAHRAGLPPRPDHESDRVRVLLVDDEEPFVTSLRRVLGRRNMEVSGVFDATAALARLDERLFDVVVSDVRMPGLNGLELLARITAMDTPPLVILLTGHPSIDVALKGMRAGAFDYLIKPPEIDALVDRIRAAHHHRRSLMAQQRDARLDSIRAGRPD